MASANNFFTEDEKEVIVSAIRKTELHTTGEIRVHITNNSNKDVFKDALRIFEKLNMHKTPFRNGVLIFIAVKDRKFSVIGDEGIYDKLDKDYWNFISSILARNFSEKKHVNGLIEAIENIGNTLAKHYPNLDDIQTNNLPDDLSFE